MRRAQIWGSAPYVCAPRRTSARASKIAPRYSPTQRVEAIRFLGAHASSRAVDGLLPSLGVDRARGREARECASPSVGAVDRSLPWYASRPRSFRARALARDVGDAGIAAPRSDVYLRGRTGEAGTTWELGGSFLLVYYSP